MSLIFYHYVQGNKILYISCRCRLVMVWLRRTTHYLFIVVVAVNSTLLTINAGDYIFYTDWAWTSFVVFSISQSTMLAVGAIYYMLFTGVPGTATYYATIMTIYTWVAKGAWFALGYPYDFIAVTSMDTFSNVVRPYVLGHEAQ